MREKGEVSITFAPKTNRFDLERFFFFNRNQLASLTRELKNQMDQELRKRGINVRKSRMEPDFQKFGLKYQAEYDPPKRYGVAIGPAIQAAVKAVVKAIIKAIKAIIKVVINAIKSIVRFIQKLMVYIKNKLQVFNSALRKLQTLTFEGVGNLDPNNPEKELNDMETKVDKELGGGASSNTTSSGILSSQNSWLMFGGLGALALVLVLLLAFKK